MSHLSSDAIHNKPARRVTTVRLWKSRLFLKICWLSHFQRFFKATNNVFLYPNWQTPHVLITRWLNHTEPTPSPSPKERHYAAMPYLYVVFQVLEVYKWNSSWSSGLYGTTCWPFLFGHPTYGSRLAPCGRRCTRGTLYPYPSSLGMDIGSIQDA